MPLEAGGQIGAYRIESQLGQGGMGPGIRLGVIAKIAEGGMGPSDLDRFFSGALI